jgi:hypothetical protein
VCLLAVSLSKTKWMKKSADAAVMESQYVLGFLGFVPLTTAVEIERSRPLSQSKLCASSIAGYRKHTSGIQITHAPSSSSRISKYCGTWKHKTHSAGGGLFGIPSSRQAMASTSAVRALRVGARRDGPAWQVST